MAKPRCNELSSTDKWILGLSFLGAAIYTGVALHQMGYIKRLPDPPGFSSNELMLTETAYPYGIPDGVLATGSMLANIPLTLNADRAGVAGVSAVKSVTEAGIAAWFLYQMRFKYRVWCIYCITAGGIYFSLAGLAVKRLLHSQRHSC